MDVLLLETPQICPVTPRLALVGLAAGQGSGPADGSYAVLSVDGDEVYVGPDLDSATQQSMSILVALMAGSQGFPADNAVDVLDWVFEQWSLVHHGLAELPFRAAPAYAMA